MTGDLGVEGRLSAQIDAETYANLVDSFWRLYIRRRTERAVNYFKGVFGLTVATQAAKTVEPNDLKDGDDYKASFNVPRRPINGSTPFS